MKKLVLSLLLLPSFLSAVLLEVESNFHDNPMNINPVKYACKMKPYDILEIYTPHYYKLTLLEEDDTHAHIKICTCTESCEKIYQKPHTILLLSLKFAFTYECPHGYVKFMATKEEALLSDAFYKMEIE